MTRIEQYRARREYERARRRKQAIHDALFVVGLICVIFAIGVCGGIERGTIHILGI